jgi:branched-chain amino acid transport system substrate-binding protein
MARKSERLTKSLPALVLGCIFGFAFGTQAIAFQNEGTVRVGVLESQTGTYSPFGLANMWGTLIAFDEINAAGGVTVDGKKVKIQVTPSPNGYDAGVDPAQSISLLKRLLLDDKVLMVKGVSNSNSGTAVFNYLAELEKEGNPIVVHSSSVGTPGLTKLSQYAFRNSFIENADVVGSLVNAAVKETQAKSAAFFVIKDNPYYTTIVEKFIVPALKSAGVEVKVMTDGVTSDRDFSRQVNEIRAANPDLVFVLAPTLGTVSFMKEAKRRQLKPKLFLGSQSVVTAEALQSGAEAIDGMVASGAFDPQSPQIAAVAAEYKKRTGQEITFYVVTGYEAGYLIKDAIERSGIKNTGETLVADRKKFRDAFASTSITSPIGQKATFTSDRETPKPGVNLVVKNGQFVVWKTKS